MSDMLFLHAPMSVKAICRKEKGFLSGAARAEIQRALDSALLKLYEGYVEDLGVEEAARAMWGWVCAVRDNDAAAQTAFFPPDWLCRVFRRHLVLEPRDHYPAPPRQRAVRPPRESRREETFEAILRDPGPALKA